MKTSKSIGSHLTIPATFALSLLSLSTLTAGSLPGNLGNGLRELLEQKQAAAQPGAAAITAPTTTKGGADPARLMQFDQSGRVLIDILLDSATPYDQTRAAIAVYDNVQLVAEDRDYRSGVIEAYLPVDAVAIVARTAGVSAVHASLKPQFSVGAVTSQGVVQHRVDKIPQFDGSGITVGVISDTFNTAPSTLTRAKDDIASGDLPAEGVAILQESGVGNDEGRAMCQVVHDMAPGAALGFATANGGEVNFANNIRSLAGFASGTNARRGFKADIIVDDAFYIDEPYYSDGITSRAIDQVAAAGVSYFNAAGNIPPIEAYASDLRLVPFDPKHPGAPLAGTNIDLTGVDPTLYAGGFHNFNPNPGQRDIAQAMQAFAGVIIIDLQWDDPYDVTMPRPLRTLFSASRRARNDADGNPIPVDVVFRNDVAGATDRIDLLGSSNQTSKRPVPLDATITVFDPSGKVVSADGEVNTRLLLTFEKIGNYTIRITGNNFLTGDAADTGPFTVKVSTVRDTPDLVTSDFNALLFDGKGKFVGALASDNIANHRPVEVGTIALPDGVFDYQLVIARANTPRNAKIASRLHYLLHDGNSNPAEYFSYFTPTETGHAHARGAITVAAYGPFRPYIPESYTSPGLATILFDDHNRRLDQPEMRLKPDVAALDGANTTFFGGDTSRDLDTFPNFFGTSCAAPSAAGIGALVLQAHGGPGSVTAPEMKSVLQRSAFPHDLDPNFAQGLADVIRANGKHNGTVTVTAISDSFTFGSFFVVDPNENMISYDGPGSINSITFHAAGGNVTGGNVEGSFPGLVFDPRPFSFSAFAGLPFTFGDSVGISRSNVTATFSHQAPLPSQEGQFFDMTIQFTPGRFTSGNVLRYAIDRDEQHSAFNPTTGGDSRNGDSADLLGAGVLIPQGKIIQGGVTFEGTVNDAGTFKGIMANRIGAGYSILDGFGFINAQRAVNEPLSSSTPVKQ